MTPTLRELKRDERGMSTPLSHVLSVAITTLLILALVASATGFLDTHKQRTATDELRTIGNRMAAELANADALAQDGDGVSVTTRHPDTVAGTTYSVSLVNGTSACGALSDNTTHTCLKLNATRPGITEIVPVHNETDLQLQPRGPGSYTITSPGGTGTAAADPRRLELSPRVGVGQEVGSNPSIAAGSNIASAPQVRIVNRPFVIDPDIPHANEPVEFDASTIYDPDGSIDEYQWDFNGDGAFEVTGETDPERFNTFTDPGRKTVTVRAIDNSGMSNSFNDTIIVGGLTYNNDLEVMPSNSDGIQFTVTNDYAQDVEIERILIDPVNSDLDEVSEDTPQECDFRGCESEEEPNTPPHEIEVNDTSSPGIDGHVDWNAYDSERLSIPDDGAFVALNEDGSYRSGQVSLQDSHTARITIKDFTTGPTVENEDFTLGVRYYVGGQANRRVINATVSP